MYFPEVHLNYHTHIIWKNAARHFQEDARSVRRNHCSTSSHKRLSTPPKTLPHPPEYRNKLSRPASILPGPLLWSSQGGSEFPQAARRMMRVAVQTAPG